MDREAPDRTFKIAGQFYAVVQARGRSAYQVLVGGVKKGCVTIDVNLARQPPEGVLNVSYDQRCNATATLPRGVGTIAMLRAAIAFAFREFPQMRAVYLKDQSYVVCTFARRYYIAAQNLAIYGKTWYERAIGAVPDSERHGAALRAFADHCKATPAPDWQTLQPFLAARRGGDGEDGAPSEAALRARLSDAASLRAFVAALRRDFGCRALEHWLPAYFNHFTAGAVWFPEMDFRVDRDAHADAAATLEAEALAESPYAAELADRRAREMRVFDVLELAPPARRSARRGGI